MTRIPGWVVVVVVLVAGGREAAAVTSNDTWQTFSMTPQTGRFDVELDVTPRGVDVDGVVGLCAGPVTEYDDLAVIVRFNDSGTIDARNGDSYRAESTVLYEADVIYHLRMVVDIAAHTYDVWVTSGGGSETVLAASYGFRTTQVGVTELSHWATLTAFGTMEVDNLSATVATTDPGNFSGAIAAGCESGEYYDVGTGACVRAEEHGCTAVSGWGATLVFAFLLLGRLRV